MKSHKIITLPHQSLRQPSRKVGLIDETITSLVDEMTKQSLAWEDSREHEVAVALAAVQIDELWKVIIIREDFDNRENKTFIPLINPEITKYTGEVVEDFEGCLSVKDFYAKVPRYSKIRLKARTLDGQEIKVTAEDFLARVLQHEIDHTKGITIVDRVEDLENGFQILKNDGKLEYVSYSKVVKAGVLKDEHL